MNPIVATSLAALTTTQIQPIVEWLLSLLGLNPPVAVAAGLSALAVGGMHSFGQWFQARQAATPATPTAPFPTQPTSTGS